MQSRHCLRVSYLLDHNMGPDGHIACAALDTAIHLLNHVKILLQVAEGTLFVPAVVPVLQQKICCRSLRESPWQETVDQNCCVFCFLVRAPLPFVCRAILRKRHCALCRCTALDYAKQSTCNCNVESEVVHECTVEAIDSDLVTAKATFAYTNYL